MFEVSAILQARAWWAGPGSQDPEDATENTESFTLRTPRGLLGISERHLSSVPIAFFIENTSLAHGGNLSPTYSAGCPAKRAFSACVSATGVKKISMLATMMVPTKK
jgi:hypothetical protein